MAPHLTRWKRPAKSSTHRSRAEAARAMGMSLNQFDYLKRAGVLSRNQDGLWHTDEIAEALQGREEAALLGAQAGGRDAKSPALERYRAARAAIAELELEEKRGNLLTLESVRDGLTTSNAVLCARLATYPRRAALALGQPGIEAQLDAMLRQDLAQCRLEVAGVKFKNPDGAADE